MCGICGQYNPEGVNPDDLRSMLQVIAHRGPDDQGVYLNGAVGLGSRRLSIIDPVGGRQPLSNEDQTIWIVCNGEIYNYRQLRAELQGRGHSFRTNTDTEVIVHLYEELGERCVERLRGMFAFAIWDSIARKLVLARDRLGQKPLFYSQDGDRFLFGSEAKAILAVSRQPRELDHESLHHYFSLRFIPPPATMFRHVRKLPPAHLLILERGAVRVSRYWSLSFRDKLNLSQEQAEERLREELSDAVGTHLVSDVPVGALLSGGMDSSVVVALAAQQLSEPLATFSIGVKAQDFNELPFARIVADRCQTRHTEQTVDVDLVRMLPKIIWHMDEPSDPIAACQFSSAALAARQVKVVLGGDGGDELFAGFDRYAGLRHVDRYARIPELLRRGVGPLLRGVPDTFSYKSLGQKLRWVDRLASLNGTAARYAEATSFFRFSHLEKQDVFTPDLWQSGGKPTLGGRDHRPVRTGRFRRPDRSHALRGLHDTPARALADVDGPDDDGPWTGAAIAAAGSSAGRVHGGHSQPHEDPARRVEGPAAESCRGVSSPDDHAATETGVHVPRGVLVPARAESVPEPVLASGSRRRGRLDPRARGPTPDRRTPDRAVRSSRQALDAAQLRVVVPHLYRAGVAGCRRCHAR
jgi:asparagine synthase (glutamine-hydrolysing)